METLQIGARTRSVPSTWNELSRPQLLAVLAELYRAPQPRPPRLLSLLTGFSLAELLALHPSLYAQLLPLLDFLSDDAHLLTAQLLPVLRLPGRHVTEPTTPWHGPRESLRNLRFGEFMFADTFFVLHCQAEHHHYLDKFLAVLYRPARRHHSPRHADWDGDRREPFNEHMLERRADRARPIAPLEKLAVLTWYRGCRQQLAQEFPDVFVASEQDAGTSQNQVPDWGRVLRKLSGGAFGTVQQTSGQPLRLVLAEMQDAAADYHRLKAQSQS